MHSFMHSESEYCGADGDVVIGLGIIVAPNEEVLPASLSSKESCLK